MTRRTATKESKAPKAPKAARPPLSARLMRATFRGLPARQYEIGWEPGLAVPAADGSPLITDHYFPRADGDFPTLLVRSPYGRGFPWSPMYGILFAEQGFHVVIQSTRGTGGSGGEFALFRNDAADGLAAVAWLREQPWFNGVLGTTGPSYLGYTQWALAQDPPPELRAMVVQVGMHDPHAYFHQNGTLALENFLISGLGMAYTHLGFAPFMRATMRLTRHMKQVTSTLPLRKAYVPGFGGEVPWLEDVLTHPDAASPFWYGASMSHVADRHTVPTALITGWHDVLADQTLAQYARLRDSGCETSLLVGPWTHNSALQQGWPEVFTETLAWLRAHLCDDFSTLRPTRVRVHMGGSNDWHDLDDWSPAAADLQPAAAHLPPPADQWFLAPDGHLVPEQPPAPTTPVDSTTPTHTPTPATPLATFRYDPSDPTPSLGGRSLSRTAGARDNTRLESRDDVLTFTTPPLTEPLTLLGPISLRVRISTDTGHADLFARLCDVDTKDRSTNICDTLIRLHTTSGTPTDTTIPLPSTAHHFPAGHRLRLQLSGGAHPRYARNTGTPEPLADATTLTPTRTTLHTPSVLLLPLP